MNSPTDGLREEIAEILLSVYYRGKEMQGYSAFEELEDIKKVEALLEQYRLQRSVETLGLSGDGDVVRVLEQLLLRQAKLTIASSDKRSANKYEILPDILEVLEQSQAAARIDELTKNSGDHNMSLLEHDTPLLTQAGCTYNLNRRIELKATLNKGTK